MFSNNKKVLSNMRYEIDIDVLWGTGGVARPDLYASFED